MKDCIDPECEFKDTLHIHIDDERLDIVEDDKYTFIFDRKENSYMRISKLSQDFIKYWTSQNELP